jgi:hypothetical protein
MDGPSSTNVRGVLSVNFLAVPLQLITGKTLPRAMHRQEAAGTGYRSAWGRSIVLIRRPATAAGYGGDSVFLFRPAGLDGDGPGQSASATKPAAASEIGASFTDSISVTSPSSACRSLVSKSGLEQEADGLIPGTLFDSIHVDHENGFVVLNPMDRATAETP